MIQALLQSHQNQCEQASQWFEHLRDQICSAFEQIEQNYSGEQNKDLPAGQFERKEWPRFNEDGTPGGGGVMSIMRGRVFEKVGVNISTVHGTFSENFRAQIPGAKDDGLFWASGVSLVAHMHNPHVPAVHMNTRHIITSGKSWFGGGADMTPTPECAYQEDTDDFHHAFKAACDTYDESYYPEYKEWCDRYFYLPHRNEARGIGGIFYDYLNTDNWDNDFSFTKDVGKAFLDIYPKIARRRMNTPWSESDKQHQLIKRSRYVEFNLLYDRGTKFGLNTGGNTEAILMSMPPQANWP